MIDRVEHMCGSRIQHGHHSNRIYVMCLNPAAVHRLIPKLDRLAAENHYGKITAKIPAACWKAFNAAGYRREATVPGFFSGYADGLFVAKFFSVQRQKPEKQVEASALSGTHRSIPPPAGPAPSIVAGKPSDADALSRIYSRVFDSYPVPIDQPQYIKQLMKNNVVYVCIRSSRQIVASAAAEIDSVYQHCEMTDFATLPPYRGNGFAGNLLGRLHDQTRRQGMKTAFAIARADSPGMNRVFEKAGYRFAGRLTKNTQIGGRIRSMNVWYRKL